MFLVVSKQVVVIVMSPLATVKMTTECFVKTLLMTSSDENLIMRDFCEMGALVLL